MHSAPSPPQYHMINYTSPQPLQQAGYSTGNIPQVFDPTQVMQQGAAVEGMLPSWLQLSQYNNPQSPTGGGPWSQPLVQQTENWYNQNVTNPAVAQAVSQQQQGGQNYGSFGGAQAGQLQAQGNQNAFQAALAANQANFQNVLGGRQSYYSGGPAVAQQQNQSDIARAFGIAGLNQDVNLQNMAQANNYNLGAAQMANNFMTNQYVNPNAFNLENYGNKFQANAYNNSLVGNAIGGGLMAGALGASLF